MHVGDGTTRIRCFTEKTRQLTQLSYTDGNTCTVIDTPPAPAPTHAQCRCAEVAARASAPPTSLSQAIRGSGWGAGRPALARARLDAIYRRGLASRDKLGRVFPDNCSGIPVVFPHSQFAFAAQRSQAARFAAPTRSAMADDEAYVSGNLQSGFAGSDQVQASVATPSTALTLGGHAVELLPAAKSDPSAATAPSRSYKLPGIARAKGDPDSGPGSHAKGPTPGTAAATPTAQLASRFGKMLEATSPTSDYGSLSMPSLPSMSEETSAKQPPSLPSKSQTAPPSVVEKGAVSTEGGASVAHERPSARTKRALEGRDTEEERLESGFVDDNVEAMEEEGEEPSPQRTTPPPPSRPPPSSSPHPLLPSSHRHSLEGPPQWETKGEAVPEAVPPVGESVEVRTDTLMEQYLARPHAGREMKRGSDGRGTEFSATKSPRLANSKSAGGDLSVRGGGGRGS